MAATQTTDFRKNLFRIILLAFAGSIIYGLPYFRSYYYDAYMEMYNLTNTQMGLLGSAYGLLGVFSYIIGGVLADKFPAKKLLIFSMISTGAGGLLHFFRLQKYRRQQEYSIPWLEQASFSEYRIYSFN